MASPTISVLDPGLQDGFILSKDEVRSIAIPLGKHLQLGSYVNLQTFDGLAVAQKAWAATLSRVSDSARSATLTDVYMDESMAVIQATLDPVTDLPTPPATPSAMSIGPMMKKTLIVYVKSHPDTQLWDLTRIPDHLSPLITQSQVRLEVAQYASQWNMSLRFFVASISQTQIEDLVDLFQQDLEESLQSLESTLPPSPHAEETPEFSEVLHPSLCPKVERCIHDLVEERVVAQPDQEAICAHDGSLSYVELSDISSRISLRLIQLGAGPEERVAILMSKTKWYPVAVLAALKAGAAFVPLDPNHPIVRAKQLVEEMKPCVIITSNSYGNKAEDLGCPHVLLLDEENMPDDCAMPPTSPIPVTPNNAAYIIFTSGSTGKPKGVVVEHSALATSAVMRGAAVGLGQDSRVLQYAPHTFDVSVDEILTTWIHGGCVCIPSESDRFMIARFMEATRVTAALLTPTSARMLSPEEVPTLKTLQTGGEVLAEDVNDKWSNRVTLFNVYGPTEASIACIMSNRTGLQGTGHTLGRAIGGSCWVVDSEDVSQRMPPGEVGELVIAGPILARGYFGDPVRTESSFVRLGDNGERIYKTGDLASMDAAGVISYHGRKDLEIKIRGQRINIAEVEHALLQNDSVHSVVVEYPRSGLCAKKLTALLRLETDPNNSEVRQPEASCFDGARGLSEDLMTLFHSHVSSVLPTAMVPSKWLIILDLPQTTSGKVDRKEVRTWLEEMDEPTHLRIFYGAEEATATLMSLEGSHSSPETSLVSVWSQVLRVEPRHLKLDKSFIRNGGDSIMAMEARHLAHAAGLVIDIRDLLTGHTLQEIAAKSYSISTSGPAHPIDQDTDIPFALSPVQQMYFDNIRNPELGLQQRVCIEITRHIGTETMRSALDSLFHTHRMLGARFTLQEGSWMQHIPDESNREQLYGLYHEAPASLEDFCTQPMDIETGPLFHAHLVESEDDGQTLVLCAHHLVVDFVSWRIILHDLHNALTTAWGAQNPQPPRRSTLTFQQWCRQQQEYASSLDPETVLPFPPGPINLDFWQPDDSLVAPNTYANLEHHDFRLSSAQTARILARFNNMPSVHPTDAMIGAFSMAFQSTFPEREAPTVFVEGHGREPWQPSLDISHTVGWFTAAYPVHLPLEMLEKSSAAISAASERRRATPANGHSYWACRYLSPRGRGVFAGDQRHQQMEVVFNYAGTVVQRAPGQGLFGENVRTTEVGHPECPRFSLFDISASIEQPNQELVISYSFPGHIRHRDRVHEVMQMHRDLLVRAVDEEDDGENQGRVLPANHCPEDFSSLLVDCDVDIERDVEIVYPASLLQQHMLHRQSLEPWYYRVEGTWNVRAPAEATSPVELDRLIQAWREVVQRHSTLRTAYQYSPEQQKYFAVVLRTVCPEIECIRGADDQNTRSICRDAKALLPPHRMVLREVGDGSVECMLEFSHVIIDAASRSIILRDLVDAYEGRLQSRALESLSFWDYMSRNQISENHSATSPSPLRSLHPAGRVASLTVPLAFSDTLLSRACREHEITLSSLFMSAWMVVLSRQMECSSVAFDYVLSDRSADIAGVEEAVGPYIRLPTCEMTVTQDIPMAELSRRIHAQRTQVVGPGLHLPSVQAGAQRFTTLVNVRNSGTESLEMRSETMQWSLKGFNDPWDYDLVLAVNLMGSQVLGCSIDYAEGVVSESAASDFAQEMAKTMETMVQEMDHTQEEFDDVELS